MSSNLKILSFLILLSGCAKETASEFVPFTPENTSPQYAYLGDLTKCREYAKDYLSDRGSINPSQVLQEGSRAGLSDLGYSAISPMAPALGAAGGASGEIVSELGLSSQEVKKIIAWCMHDKGLQHGYSVWDPNL